MSASIWNPSGFLGTLFASAINFVQSGIGAIVRTVQIKLQETTSIDDWATDSTTDYYAAYIAATNALTASRKGGTLLFTIGKEYNTNTPFPMINGITYKGTGRSTTNSTGLNTGAKIVSSTSSIFDNSNDLTTAGIKFENLWLESKTGGGHIFDWTGTGLVARIEFTGVTLFQSNPNKSCINGQAQNGVFSIYIKDSEWYYRDTATVPALNIKSPTVNSITISDCWSNCSAGFTGGAYSIHIESTNPTGPAFNVDINNIVFEVPGGGAINLLSARQSKIENCGIYDLLVPPGAALFNIAKGASGPTTSGISFKRNFSNIGTTTNPDLRIDCSVAGNSGFIVEQCTLAWYDAVSANGASVLHIANSIANYKNSAYVSFGAAQKLDLEFKSQDASAGNFAIWNGFPGTRNGYLNISQGGTDFGAISKTGLFQWGGTEVSPNYYIAQTGQLNTKHKIYAGTPALTDQAACGLFMGTGVPSNANGNNGDFYLRGDTPGTANQRLYVKSAGVWTGIA